MKFKIFHYNVQFMYKFIVSQHNEYRAEMISKYIIENVTNETINDLLKKIRTLKDNEKYIELLNGICKGIIRSQYDKIDKMNVKTIIYSNSSSLTPEKLKENIDFNKRSGDNVIYYYVIDDSEYLIYGKYASQILNNIYGLM